MHPLFHPLFINYCIHFNGNQDYFECHEVLEEYWKEISPGEKKHPLVGYVQLATGMYHWRRNNLVGASRILQKALENFRLNEKSPFFDFIDYVELCKHCSESIAAINMNFPFTSFQLKITDSTLLIQVKKQIDELPKISSNFLLHKHMLRDRSDILRARELKKSSKNKM